MSAKWKAILLATLTAGILDITAACINAYIENNVPPKAVLQYIASGVFSAKAFSGDPLYPLFGLGVHFFIVFMCALMYFFFYPRLSFLRNSVAASALIIALVAWFVTTRIIIPLSAIPAQPFMLQKEIVTLSILIICVGLPIAFVTKRYYTLK